ncbi:DNA repair protein RecO [Hyphomicrobium sp. xq]|uniref:DNA repair protein RecO n=1 Tax=Hyphomicrobium album TaxID=2665159 RepID=A0A6I3KE79_9HYPH|nr:DNA repair protein RecO [Hyphomicrobium album]MTD93174.1 DNA repair protein RecO [Hyphomicrobium album]
MQWSDEGIILSVKAYGETAAVAEIFTRAHGRHLGLVHGGRSRRMRPVLQTGNHVDATWKARLAEQLGHVTVELRKGYAAQAMEDPLALAGLSSLCALSRLLPERDPHAALFEVALFVLGYLDEPEVWPALMVRWELALLEELGFGLDLVACAATGANDNLIYVSPKSGRAVSASAGDEYKDRLLRLPGFLLKGRQGAATSADVIDGLALTGHFLETRVLIPRGDAMPAARVRMKDLIVRRAAAAA